MGRLSSAVADFERLRGPMSSVLTLTKEQCRVGLEAEDRRLVWYLLATAPCDGTVPTEPVRTFPLDTTLTAQLSRSASRYQHALREVFGNVGVPKRCFRLPFLGVEPSVLPEGAGIALRQGRDPFSPPNPRTPPICTDTVMTPVP